MEVEFSINDNLLGGIIMENEELIKLGKRIVELRKFRGISQENLAFECGLSRKGLSNIEIGVSDPKYTTLIKISNALGVTIYDMLNPSLMRL